MRIYIDDGSTHIKMLWEQHGKMRIPLQTDHGFQYKTIALSDLIRP
ncbi:hypothetical protein [Citrobacter freundii]